MCYYVYIATNLQQTVFYVGITRDLEEKMFFHRTNIQNVQKKNQIKYLMYAEVCLNAEEACSRRNFLNNLSPKTKRSMIVRTNPYKEDLLQRQGKVLCI